MDPITLIASAPPDWIPYLIILAILYKGWTYWVDKRAIRKGVAEVLNKEPDDEV